MRLFLSYASEQVELAEALTLRLRNSGIEVFFDRDRIVAGDAFDQNIRNAVAHADLFVFLASSDSLRVGAYPMTELSLAQKRWPRATGHVLPVLTPGTSMESLPAYLRSVSVLQPKGDLIADVVNTVARRSTRVRVALVLRWVVSATLILVPVLSWYVFLRPNTALEIRDVTVTKTKDGFSFKATLRNRSPEAVTTVSLYPEADKSGIRFSGSSEWFVVNRGEDSARSVVFELVGADGAPKFNWRLCWLTVNAMDLDLAKDVKPIDRFIDQRGKTVCTGFRPWLPERGA